jgi:hypothetical protein
MTSTLKPEPARGDASGAEFDEARSISGALRITLLFVAVVILLLWAGVADAAGPERASASVPDPSAVGSSLPGGRS